MNDSLIAVAEQCTHGSDNGELTFPQVVGKLAQAGIERYHVDLQRGEKTYYLPTGESHIVMSAPIAGDPQESFTAARVEVAVRKIQAGTISYKDFCAQIMAAGCVGYFVSLAGKRAVYYGRTNEDYIEPFPKAPAP
jgi:uncharacterized protein YbcV (DUF1398 family)